MDAPNPSSKPTFANLTPLHIGSVALVVRDLDKVAGYYRQMLGLSDIEQAGDTLKLGAGGVPFLELIHRPDAKPDDARQAGLYHTAFLMPTRADLARWILHVARTRVPITGASDHAVSEAFYLDDPEGNGVEVYWDRPSESWEWTGNDLKITTDPLDIENIVQEVDPQTADYSVAPEGLRIGHVHLRVGDVDQAEAFYRDSVGLDVTRRRHGASFLSNGRYHHHLAGNVWHSAGAGQRDPDRAGLAWFSFEASDATTLERETERLRQAGVQLHDIDKGVEAIDPWGTRVRFLPA